MKFGLPYGRPNFVYLFTLTNVNKYTPYVTVLQQLAVSKVLPLDRKSQCDVKHLRWFFLSLFQIRTPVWHPE